MLTDLTEAKGIRDERVLEAIRGLERHRFVPEPLRLQAYGDHALPIGCDQTISQPYIVARMTELLAVSDDCSVLELGTGSGYQTAVLAQLARFVFSIERIGELARQAMERIKELGYQNVKIQIFDGTIGWSEVAPFDRILVTAASPEVPASLVDQLEHGGRMVIPVGTLEHQRLLVVEKDRFGDVHESWFDEVKFVPLIGRQGFSRDEIS